LLARFPGLTAAAGQKALRNDRMLFRGYASLPVVLGDPGVPGDPGIPGGAPSA
jgi:hypothetical protein